MQGLSAAIHWSEGRAEHKVVFDKAQALLNTINNKGTGEQA